jgi:cytoskeletal protein CcmA (bactofilin family)
MFNRADKFQDVSQSKDAAQSKDGAQNKGVAQSKGVAHSKDVAQSKARDDQLRDQFPRSQPHPARSFDQPNAPMRIGKTVVIKGELMSHEDMVIFGRVEGTITVKEHTVTIGKDASIEAEIKAHCVVVEGQVTGNVEASEQLEIRPGGVVIGNVKTPSLVIRDGAALKGSVDMDADRPKTKPSPEKEEEPATADDKNSPFKRDQLEGEKVAAT